MTSPGSAEHPAGPASRSGHIPDWVPLVIYLLIAAATLGLAAVTASTNMIADQPNKDIWQHVAAVRALMENLSEPRNPFVVSPEPSRHFQPLWVATAVVGNALNLTVWQAVTVATFAIMLTLAFAIHFFSHARCSSRPGPRPSCYASCFFAWSGPYEHTGLHSFWTLLYAAAYPATFMIALSLLLWAMVIRALGDPRYLPALVLLSAVMLATHQLGAVIGFIGGVVLCRGATRCAGHAPPGRPDGRLDRVGGRPCLAVFQSRPTDAAGKRFPPGWVGRISIRHHGCLESCCRRQSGCSGCDTARRVHLRWPLGSIWASICLDCSAFRLRPASLCPSCWSCMSRWPGLLLEAMTWVRLRRPVLRQVGAVAGGYWRHDAGGHRNDTVPGTVSSCITRRRRTSTSQRKG